jgi:hypothetical protein
MDVGERWGSLLSHCAQASGVSRGNASMMRRSEERAPWSLGSSLVDVDVFEKGCSDF